MTPRAGSRNALVFGASGMVGRHLVLTLAKAGANVTAAVRNAESGARVERWVREHGLERRIRTTIVDFDAPGIVAGGPSTLPFITEIHNCAGTYRFGMTAQEARSANVGIVEKLIDFAKMGMRPTAVNSSMSKSSWCLSAGLSSGISTVFRSIIC